MHFNWIRSISPLAASLADYRSEKFIGDLIAGLVVAIMLVPQAMAYAMLAGLPPETGLYASIVPLVLYSLFGTSNALAVGPVAMISLLVLTGISEFASPGSPEFIRLCLTLALLVGALQIAMGALRLGFLVNFISHPVLVGFTSAAAIIIAVSQAKHLFGISVDAGNTPYLLIAETISAIEHADLATLTIGIASCGVLTFFGYGVSRLLRRVGLKESHAQTIAKVGPLIVVAAAALLMRGIDRDGSGAIAIVGEIPAGLPMLTWPAVRPADLRALLPLALVVSLVGYMESISVAKTLATRKREKVAANRELFALGMADIGAAFTGGYPVTGGFSRSMVNFSAGVRTPFGSMITAALVTVSVVFLTPLFFYIPKATLAAIIVVAVLPLIDIKTPFKLWRYSRSDLLALGTTFVAVLVTGIEVGILVGIAATVVTHMWRMSRPHVAEVGRVDETEHFRNVSRHEVKLTPGVLALRIDESLTFANASFLEAYIMEQVSDRPDLRSVLLIASGINDVDATGVEFLGAIQRELETIGIGLFLSDVKGPVIDRLERAGFARTFLDEHVFLSAHAALSQICPDPQNSE